MYYNFVHFLFYYRKNAYNEFVKMGDKFDNLLYSKVLYLIFYVFFLKLNYTCVLMCSEIYFGIRIIYFDRVESICLSTRKKRFTSNSLAFRLISSL